MKSGTEKNPNPHSVSLKKFLLARSANINHRYVELRNGQLLRPETFEFWKYEATKRRQESKGD